MQIFRRLAGYSLGQADMVRRAMSKKKMKDIQREREAFLHGDPDRGITGCTANGIPQDVAESIYDEIDRFRQLRLQQGPRGVLRHCGLPDRLV